MSRLEEASEQMRMLHGWWRRRTIAIARSRSAFPNVVPAAIRTPSTTIAAASNKEGAYGCCSLGSAEESEFGIDGDCEEALTEELKPICREIAISGIGTVRFWLARKDFDGN